MKTIFQKTAGLFLLAAGLSFCSFTPGKGGDVFEIYLNQQLLIQQYAYGNKAPGNIFLQAANNSDQLNIRYLHCGQLGKNRTLLLRDGKNNLLRQWTFNNTSLKENKMSCNVKDLIDLRKNNHSALKLYYSSEELPAEKLLVLIN